MTTTVYRVRVRGVGHRRGRRNGPCRLLSGPRISATNHPSLNPTIVRLQRPRIPTETGDRLPRVCANSAARTAPGPGALDTAKCRPEWHGLFGGVTCAYEERTSHNSRPGRHD